MENGKITESESRYLWWDDLDIGAKAAEVTGFDRDKYRDKAIDPAAVYQEVKGWLLDGNSLLCFHNGLNFDVYQIRNWFREIGAPTGFDWVKRVVDTNALAKAYLSGAKPDYKNFDAWQTKWANFLKKGLKSNITYLCENWEIPIDKSKTHQGDYDCYLTAQIYKQLVYKFQET
jgi:DNA polymerase III epsilon subunit-like protein